MSAKEKEDPAAIRAGSVSRESSEFARTHELPAAFTAHGLGLAGTLVEMLNEHFTHRTERRGSGYTQATRVLAQLVNRATADRKATIEELFPSDAQLGISAVLPLNSGHSEVADLDPGSLARTVHAIRTALELEESKLLAALILDLIVPARTEDDAPELVVSHEEIKVGTCPLAEKYFLEIGHGFVRRKGRINVFVSEAGQPLLVEKLKLGDSHSCVSVAPLLVNGVRLPPGCLFGAKYEGELEGRTNKKLPGLVVPVSRAAGFKFLRLTTLAISPEHRERAFSTHFRSQVDAGLFAPRETTIAELRRVAEEQL